MSTNDTNRRSSLSPDEAFALVGNEYRMNILQELSHADEPLSFSELQQCVDIRDSGQFNYHLDKLVDHFVRSTEPGYSLRRSGERIIEAVLSGTVTDAPVLNPTEIDEDCPYCSAPIEASFTEERVEFYCTECGGIYGPSTAQETFDIEDRGYLGRLSLPPAGLKDRTPAEIAEAAWVWGALEAIAMSLGVCPRCSAKAHRSIDVCDAHDSSEGRCESCGRRYAVNIGVTCSNCILDVNGIASVGLAGKTEFVSFQTDHGVNPFTNGWETTNYDETIHSIDPFEGAFTFTVNAEALTVTVDDDFSIVAVTREGVSDSVS